MIAKTVYYSGMVQGVGFRATVASIARDYPVTGWVKNLSDGRVQVLVEGSQQAVEAFLGAVRAHWQGHIDQEQIEDRAASGEYIRLGIVY